MIKPKERIPINIERIRQDSKTYSEDIIKIEVINFYRNGFYKNNRWNKGLILRYYDNLDIDKRSDFENNFIKYFDLDKKTNQLFIEILKKSEVSNNIFIDKKDLFAIVDAISFLKKNNQIKLSNKLLAKAIKKGFQTNYSLAYIEDELRRKNSKNLTSIESLFIKISKKIK